MPMIRLTQIPHPDLHGGQPQPAYVDASRILMITTGLIGLPKRAAKEDRQAALQRLWEATYKLTNQVSEYQPQMDDPVAVGWMLQTRETAGVLRAAYEAASKAYAAGDFHPDQECTEVQMACGTGLEHGVMLAKVWVIESPTEVASLRDAAMTAAMSSFYPGDAVHDLLPKADKVSA